MLKQQIYAPVDNDFINFTTVHKGAAIIYIKYYTVTLAGDLLLSHCKLRLREYCVSSLFCDSAGRNHRSSIIGVHITRRTNLQSIRRRIDEIPTDCKPA